MPLPRALSDPFAAFEAASRRGEAEARGSRQRRVTRLRLPRPTGMASCPFGPLRLYIACVTKPGSITSRLIRTRIRPNSTSKAHDDVAARAAAAHLSLPHLAGALGVRVRGFIGSGCQDLRLWASGPGFIIGVELEINR